MEIPKLVAIISVTLIIWALMQLGYFIAVFILYGMQQGQLKW